MKNKILNALILLICLFIFCSCSVVKEKTEIDDSQQLQIFKTDLQLTQEQKLSQIKAQHLLENKGYLDNDELVVLVNLKKEALIDSYNEKYSSSIDSVSEFALSKKGASLINSIKTTNSSLSK